MDPRTRALMMIPRAALPVVAQPSSTAVASFDFNNDVASVTRGSAMIPLMAMVKKYGSPSIKVVNDQNYRAQYVPLLNEMTVRKRGVDDVIAELAHSKQYVGPNALPEFLRGNFDDLRAALIDGDIEAQYQTPGSVEFTAHKITQPLLEDELRQRVFTQGMIRQRMLGTLSEEQ
jgi:hypothetical protein